MSILGVRKLANLTENFDRIFVIYVAIKSGIVDSMSDGTIEEFRKKSRNPRVVEETIEAGVAAGLWTCRKSLTTLGKEFTKEDPNGFRAWVLGLVELQTRMFALVPDLMGENSSDRSPAPYNFENTPTEEIGIAAAAEGMARFLGFRCLDRVKEFRKSGCTVLDIGCGNGEYLLHLIRRNPTLRATGVEMSHRLVEMGKQRLGKEILPSSSSPSQPRPVSSANLEPRVALIEGNFLGGIQEISGTRFDVCLLNLVLHYFSKDDRLKLFQRCASLLKEDGVLVILEPVLGDTGSKQRLEFAAFNLNLFPQDTTYHGLPRQSELRLALEAAGLTIQKRIRPYGVGPVMCYLTRKESRGS